MGCKYVKYRHFLSYFILKYLKMKFYYWEEKAAASGAKKKI